MDIIYVSIFPGIIARLIAYACSIVVQVLCSYSTLPLYALVTQVSNETNFCKYPFTFSYIYIYILLY